MSDFAATCRARGVRALATFGDSITAGMSASQPELRWANRLAASLGGVRLDNRGISGTVLQGSPDASGRPRPNNGYSRFRRDLLGEGHPDALAILYGCNDARYVAAPASINRDNFVRDFRDMLAALTANGYAEEAIAIGSPPHIPDAGFSVGSDGFAGQRRDVFQSYVETVRTIAREAGVFYAAVNERMVAEGGDRLLSPDHVHPNDQGHAVIAAAFAAAQRLS
jgi:lysophospholipase L1-like esterase